MVIFNDNFENWAAGSGGPPDNWAVNKVTATRESSIVHGDTYSSKVLMGNDGGYGWQYRDISTINGHALDYWKGRTLTFTCYVYCERADEAFIAIGAKDPEALNWEASSYHPGDSAWHQLSVTYTIPSNATHLNLICGVLDGPTVHMPQTPAYFDDAAVADPNAPETFMRKTLSKIGTKIGSRQERSF